MADKKMLAIDLGASSGRGIIGSFDGSRIGLNEIHRFPNDPVSAAGGFWWDTLRLLHEIKTAILNCAHNGGWRRYDRHRYVGRRLRLHRQKRRAPLQSVSLPPTARTEGVPEKVFRRLPWEELYGITGIQSMNFNTIYQIYADLTARPWIVDNADKLLLTPDLLGYFLTGERRSEYTIASTGALLDAYRRDFAFQMLAKLGIRADLFCPITEPGQELGALLPSVAGETGNTGAKVVNIASHDTASAVSVRSGGRRGLPLHQQRHVVAYGNRKPDARDFRRVAQIQLHKRGRRVRHDPRAEKHHGSLARTGIPPPVEARGNQRHV